jgi:hypothetical protein
MPLHLYAAKERLRIFVASTRAPAPPSGLLASSVSASEIDLSWTDNSANETGFLIQRSLNGSTWATLTSVAANTIRYQDTDLPASTTYYYHLSAYNAAGGSSWSGTASTTTQASALTSYTLAGPSSDSVNAASTNFTVWLGTGTLAGSVMITPNDGGAGGTFTPSTVSLTNTARSAFTYTPVEVLIQAHKGGTRRAINHSFRPHVFRKHIALVLVPQCLPPERRWLTRRTADLRPTSP